MSLALCGASSQEDIARSAYAAYGKAVQRGRLASNPRGRVPGGQYDVDRYLRNALKMVVLAPLGASDTYGQLSDIGADTIRAPRDGSAWVPFTVKWRSTSRTIYFD